MTLEIAHELEVGGETGLVQHPIGVPADREDLAGLDAVVLIELQSRGRLVDGAAVDDGLTVVLAGILLGGTILLVYFTRNSWMQWGFAQKIAGFATGMVEGLRSLRTVNNKPLFWFYSIGIWTCYVATIAVGFTIVSGLENIGPEQAFFVSVAAGLGFVIPVPGGIGAYHYLVSKALVVLGLTPFVGTSFATLIHSSQSLMFVVTGALGFVFLYFAGRK